jgi:hypothetical protein
VKAVDGDLGSMCASSGDEEESGVDGVEVDALSEELVDEFSVGLSDASGGVGMSAVEIDDVRLESLLIG